MGQVIALLYVVMTSQPSVILIDEPQSFLHPGAVRKLIQILKLYPQHQYIIATHSPTVITSVNPDTITIVGLEGGRSVLRSVDAPNATNLQICLSEIGARLSDVFGADTILWVEGSTEEICFPKILARIAKQSLMGTVITPIRNTGELERKDAKRVIEIYNRLSQSNALIPPAIAFVLDEECRTEPEKQEMKTRSDGKAFFMPRRMYENYLLNPRAIAAVLNQFDKARPQPLTEAEVQDLIKQKFDESRYYCKQDQPIPTDTTERFCHIHASNLLKDIFKELSDTRVAFEKPEHSVLLTDWIIENSPDDLRELADFLVQDVLSKQE